MTTILVVDDEPAVRDAVEIVLAMEGHTVVTCSDGQTALDILDSREVSAAMIDLSLPSVRGVTVIAALRAARPELPIIVMSGLLPEGPPPTHGRLYQLAKPFGAAELRRLVAGFAPVPS